MYTLFFPAPQELEAQSKQTSVLVFFLREWYRLAFIRSSGDAIIDHNLLSITDITLVGGSGMYDTLYRLAIREL